MNTTYTENPIMVATIEEMIRKGDIQMPEDRMEPLDTEGWETQALCVCKDRQYGVILVAMCGKSNERQAAEQICRAMYEEQHS